MEIPHAGSAPTTDLVPTNQDKRLPALLPEHLMETAKAMTAIVSELVSVRDAYGNRTQMQVVLVHRPSWSRLCLIDDSKRTVTINTASWTSGFAPVKDASGHSLRAALPMFLVEIARYMVEQGAGVRSETEAVAIAAGRLVGLALDRPDLFRGAADEWKSAQPVTA